MFIAEVQQCSRIALPIQAHEMVHSPLSVTQVFYKKDHVMEGAVDIVDKAIQESPHMTEQVRFE